MEWIPLTTPEQLDSLLKDPTHIPVAIFKHSTRCGISRMVLRRLEGEIQRLSPQADLYLLDLLKYRRLSDQVSERLGIVHHSPQLIVLKEGKLVHHASHEAISAETLL